MSQILIEWKNFMFYSPDSIFSKNEQVEDYYRFSLKKRSLTKLVTNCFKKKERLASVKHLFSIKKLCFVWKIFKTQIRKDIFKQKRKVEIIKKKNEFSLKMWFLCKLKNEISVRRQDERNLLRNVFSVWKE